MTETTRTERQAKVEGHGGALAVAVARRRGVSAVFTAEGLAKLTRVPGLAVVTAGPGVTNSVSAVTTAWFNGSPLLVLGGRAPQARWGSGSLQELDHPPLLAPVTKRAATVHRVGDIAAEVDALARVAALLGGAQRPVLVLGSDVWADHAEQAARRAAEALGLPVIANGLGRGVLPAGHELLVTRARSLAFGAADLVIVAGAPLDFRLGYGAFGGSSGQPARVVQLADSPGQLATHVALAEGVAGSLAMALDGLVAAAGSGGRASRSAWLG